LTGADALPCEEEEPEALGVGAEAEACEPEVEVPWAAACESAALGAEPGTADPELDAAAPPVPVVGEKAAAEAGAPV